MNCMPARAPTPRWRRLIRRCTRRSEPAPSRSGRNIGKKTIFDEGNLVLELQLAFFQPRQLQLIAMRGTGNCSDRRIEIAVLLTKLSELRSQNLFFFIGHGTGEPLLELGAQQGDL